MGIPAFASIEATISAMAHAVFTNLVLTDGSRTFSVVLDRAAEVMGEFGLTGETRHRIKLLRAASNGLAIGDTLTPDPATYTPAEIAAMPRQSFVLDRVESDDGHIVGWWLK